MFRTAVLFITSVGFFASCRANTPNNSAGSSAADTALKPVETKSPNSDYKPAFAGQTRVAGVKTMTPFETKVVTNALKRPWGITALPDGRLLITEKAGNMRIATIAGQLNEPITGIPAVNAGGQGGLLGILRSSADNDPLATAVRFPSAVLSENTQYTIRLPANSGSMVTENATVIYRATPAFPNNMHYGAHTC